MKLAIILPFAPRGEPLCHTFLFSDLNESEGHAGEGGEGEGGVKPSNYLRFAITAFCLFNSTYVCSSGILVNRRMSLFLAVLCISIWRGLAGNAFLYNNMPVVCRRTSSHRGIILFTHNCKWLKILINSSILLNSRSI